MRRLAVAAGCAVLVSLAAGPAPAAQADDHKIIATITDDRIAESSALVQSTVDSDLAYTINDSGNDTVVYVLDLDTGEVVGTTTLNVDAEDTEAMAIGGDDRLYVADIGDNDAARDTIALYAIDQTAAGDTTVTPDVYEVRYSDGPSDAETLLVDPATGRMSIVTKNLLAGSVYRLPGPLRADRVNVARPIDVSAPGMVTDGAYLPDGEGVALRTYIDIVVYAVPSWREVGTIDTPPQRQSESLAAWDRRRSVLVGTEKLPSPIIQVEIPRSQWKRLHAGPKRDTERQPTAVSSTSAADQDDDGIASGWVVASGAAVIVLGGAWLWTRRPRGQRSRRAADS
ncbi:MAG: hypothetical protein ACRDP2_13520 [Nocardioidaceae bacterium]